MPNVTSISLGAPIWADLSTSDGDKARDFYGALFGWDIPVGAEAFGGYSTATLHGANVAGIMPKSGDPEAEAMPDFWTLYFHTANAAESAAAITANGGQLMMEPMAVGPFGTMAVAIDPSGGFFGIWQPDQHGGFGVMAEEGAPCWFELASRDVAATGPFYETTFGLDRQATPLGEGAEYTTFNADGEMVAGMIDGNGMLPDGVPSSWTLYFGVQDTDAAILRVKELGGSLLVDAADSPWGRWAIVSDPTGASFAIVSVGDEASAE